MALWTPITFFFKGFQFPRKMRKQTVLRLYMEKTAPIGKQKPTYALQVQQIVIKQLHVSQKILT